MVLLKTAVDISQRIVLIPAIQSGMDMYTVFSFFRTYKEYSFFPVIDSETKPIGIILEKSLKDYIYAQFGRELIRHHDLAEFVSPCTMIKNTEEPDDIITLFGDNPNPDGLIVVDSEGHYNGVLLANKLFELYEENRVEINRQLLHTQKMEAIGILAGGIAHDFNNILVPILGYTELVQRLIDDEGDEKKKYYLNQISEAAWRAKNLVKQVLTFSRQKETKFSQIKLKPLISETVKLLGASLPSTIKVECSLDLESDTVNGDPTQIHQVVMNLCINAAYAMKKTGGTLKVELQKFTELQGWSECTDIPEGEFIDLSVSDNGCGIDKHILPRIFEPFFTTKPQGEGTGMGLSVVHGIVKSYGGFISVETEINQGTTFHMILPAVCNTQESSISAVSDKPSAIGNGENILLIDDEPMIINVHEQLLTRYGYNVYAYQKSTDALESFNEKPDFYDAIITDLTMPEMTGLQLTNKVREQNSSIPILLCTGYSGSYGVTSENASEYGLSEILIKPVKIDQIVECLNRVMTQVNSEFD